MSAASYRIDELGWLQFQRLCDLVLGARSAVLTGDADRRRAGEHEGTQIVVTWRPMPQLRIGAELLGPAELSAHIDASEGLRRALPSLLGVRDLEGLITAEVRERSTIALDEAQRLARVFVTTRAYGRALEALDEHRFVVLAGPPEMGKTAIARMLGLAQMTCGWEAHECTTAEQLWARFDADRPQLFIADDAFGSTEYRPDAAERWAGELDRVLRHLDDRHRLVWTSRPAPLKAGLRRLHRERGLERFPAPGEVDVDAGSLDDEEKALILFRHAQAAALPADGVTLVRAYGRETVAHPHFTPERIRRFVTDRLPVLLRSYVRGQQVDFGAAVEQELEEPTAAMAASYRALEPRHRALLVAMLDAPDPPVHERDLAAALRRHHAGGLPQAPRELVDRLADHFVRVT
ncbi:MAG: hypothetical protein WKF94_15615 [Solirubrobacteraceae bacterium]